MHISADAGQEARRHNERVQTARVTQDGSVTRMGAPRKPLLQFQEA